MNTVYQSTPSGQPRSNGSWTHGQNDARKSPELQYAFRSKLSVQDVIREVQRLLRRVNAGSESYFNTIAHRELVKSVARHVSDAAMLALIEAWLDVATEGSRPQFRPALPGVPNGRTTR